MLFRLKKRNVTLHVQNMDYWALKDVTDYWALKDVNDYCAQNRNTVYCDNSILVHCLVSSCRGTVTSILQDEDVVERLI